MRSLKWALIAGLAGLLVLGAVRYGYDWWSVGRFIETTDDAYVGGNVTPISPHVAGFVAQILVADNDMSSAGQLLIRLDDRDLQGRARPRDRDRRRSGRRRSRASWQESCCSNRRSAQAEADLDAKAAQAAFTREEDARYRQLAQTSAGSRQNAQKALRLGRRWRNRPSSRPRLPSTPRASNLACIDAEIAEARAAVAQAEADLRTARLNLGYTEIRSPIDGYIGNRAAQVGAYVSGGTYLVTVIPAHDLWVDANFKEDQLARMAPAKPRRSSPTPCRATSFTATCSASPRQRARSSA